jgi:hypothetical protein
VPDAILAYQSTLVDQHTNDFFGVEGVTLGPLGDAAFEYPGLIIGLFEQLIDKQPSLFLRKRPEPDVNRWLIVSLCHDQQQADVIYCLDQVLHKVPGSWVDPMQVLEHQNSRCQTGLGQKDLPQGGVDKLLEHDTVKVSQACLHQLVSLFQSKNVDHIGGNVVLSQAQLVQVGLQGLALYLDRVCL